MRTEPIADRMDFKNEVIIVTGGAQGIGKSIVESFVAAGGDAAIADIKIDQAENSAEEINSKYDQEVVPIECDVTSYADTSNLMETVLERFGKIDHLVNNAATAIDAPSFVESEPDGWRTTVDVCFFGTLNCTRAALPKMIDRGEGTIVNFASDSYKGNDPGLSVYGAAKAANVSFTSTLSKEVGDSGIRVNCISPGTTRTPTTEEWIDEFEDKIIETYALGRVGTPMDIADGVLFLCSDAADWITGQTISINGGYLRG